MPLLSASSWDDFLTEHNEAHLLQTASWGELKAAFDWEVVRVISTPSSSAIKSLPITGAQVLYRRFPLGFTLAYIPKGPIGQAWGELWPEVDAICRQKKAILLKIEPDLWESSNQSGISIFPSGYKFSPHTIQPPRTLVVNLLGDEEQILGRMKQKTRYNIRLAQKKGVVVSPWSDIERFHQLMQVTGARDKFAVHSLEYYQRAYELFYSKGHCELLLAEYNHQPLAALMVFAHRQRAWYFYGASANEERERMPTYLLQWEAMRWARAHGCSEYDLWGVPDADEDILEANFTKSAEGLWGVYRFKRGFGGELRRAPGAWDRVYQPVLYAFYRWWTNQGARDQD